MARKKTTTSKKTSRKTPIRGGTGSRRSSSKKRQTKRTAPRFSLSAGQKILLVGIIVIFATAVITLSLIAPNQGQLTSWLSTFIWQMFGWGGFFIPVITGAVGLYLVLWGMEQPPELPIYRLTGVVVLFLVFSAFASMVVLMSNEQLIDYRQVSQAQSGGGFLGGFIAGGLTALVGNLGAIFTLAILGLIGAVLLSGLTRADAGQLINQVLSRKADDDPYEPQSTSRRRIRINPGRPAEPQQLSLFEDDTHNEETPEPTPPPKRKRGRKKPVETPARAPADTPTIESPVFLGSRRRQSWTLPTVAEMLQSGVDQDTNDASIREQVEVIEHTLESFGAPATVVEINQGPTVTQFGVEPNYIHMRNGRRTKVKVGKIASLQDDLALALAARSIRIQAPVPGKAYVGIEVPNVQKATVSLRDVIESPAFKKIKSPLGVGLGQNVSGQAIAADLAQMPHMLIAGTTGSGKSVCVNGIIACLLLQNTPEHLKLVMIDPKRVELTGYNGIPHLAAPVVVDMDRVISTLQWALREMDTRYKMFADVGARNIIDYNKKINRQKDVPYMPNIVIIIDELADLMMLAPEDTERSVTRLAQMARATGMHMIIATQRPSVDVVTGLIKANFPARVAFAVASSIDSRVILDSTGAERLLGQGDMLFQSPDAAAPLRLQGCFVSDGELAKLIDYWKRARRFEVISAETDAISSQDAAVAMPPTGQPNPATPAASASSPASKATTSTPKVAAPAETVTSPTAKENKPQAAQQKKPTPAKKIEEAETPTQQPLWEALQEEAEKPEYTDELMPEAIALVRKLNKASTSLLQRRFRIGYTRAARMIDAMEEMKIIGPPTGTSKAREVLSAAGDTSQTDITASETQTVENISD